MGSLCEYAENGWCDLVGGNVWSQPTNLYVGLSTSDPLNDGSGIDEPVGNGYDVVLCNSWSSAASRATHNSAAVTFPAASGSWGTITHWYIKDQDGHIIAYGALTTPRTISSGTYRFAIGQLVVSVLAGDPSDILAHALLNHTFKVSAFSLTCYYEVTGDIDGLISDDIELLLNAASGGVATGPPVYVGFGGNMPHQGNYLSVRIIDGVDELLSAVGGNTHVYLNPPSFWPDPDSVTLTCR